MDEHRKNFRDRYVNVLGLLHEKRDAGIASLMISLPLLERYLRQKNGLTPNQDLDDACMGTLRAIFPVLPDVRTARQFWSVFRNGFLHQATLSLQTRRGAALPPGELTHDIEEPIAIRADGSFVLRPDLFSRCVTDAIEADFAVFVGDGTKAPKPPAVVAVVPPAGVGIIVPPITLTTNGS